MIAINFTGRGQSYDVTCSQGVGGEGGVNKCQKYDDVKYMKALLFHN